MTLFVRLEQHGTNSSTAYSLALVVLFLALLGILRRDSALGEIYVSLVFVNTEDEHTLAAANANQFVD